MANVQMFRAVGPAVGVMWNCPEATDQERRMK